MAMIDLRQATIRIFDGSPSPNFIDVKIGEGSFDFTENRDLDVVLSRGTLDTVREKDQKPVSVNFSFIWEYVTASSGDPPTVEDALKKLGSASGWTSASPDPAAPYSVNLEVLYTPPCPSGDVESVVLPEFYWEELAHSLKDGTVSCRGIANRIRPDVGHASQ